MALPHRWRLLYGNLLDRDFSRHFHLLADGSLSTLSQLTHVKKKRHHGKAAAKIESAERQADDKLKRWHMPHIAYATVAAPDRFTDNSTQSSLNTLPPTPFACSWPKACTI